MKRNVTHVDIPFPKNLMSSSRNATNMPRDFAREIRNMIASKSGAGSKRGGFETTGPVLVGETIRTLISYVPLAGTTELLAVTESGKIYRQNSSDWTEIYTGLSTEGRVRYTAFAGKLILCNGIDDVLVYDGSTCVPITQWVASLDNAPVYVNATTFTVQSDVSFYPVGKLIRVVHSNGVTAESTVVAASDNAGTITVTLASSIINADLSAVFLQEKPPSFQMVYAAHDRLWGFGAGTLKGNTFSSNPERTFVFYTDGVNDETAWRNDVGALQFINLTDKMPASDEVLSMAVKDGLTLFFLRNHVQVWSGFDPSATGDMQWTKTIPLGVAHGDLVTTLPNDIAFFTRSGARTLSRMLQTEQLDISDLGSEVDPTLSAALDTILSDDIRYRRDVLQFRYDKQGWYGFKVGDQTFVFQLGALARGWTIFDGFFADMTAAANTPSGTLIIARGGQCYQYNDDIYHDHGTAIKTVWWTPWFGNTSLKRWANKYVEVISEQGAPIMLAVERFKNYNSASFFGTSVTVQKAEDYWDSANWDEGFWDYGASEIEQARDHFVADTFSYAVKSESIDGPLTIYGLKLYGVREK